MTLSFKCIMCLKSRHLSCNPYLIVGHYRSSQKRFDNWDVRLFELPRPLALRRIADSPTSTVKTDNALKIGFHEPSSFINFSSIPLRFSTTPNRKNVGFYNLWYLLTFCSPVACLFKLITPDFMNFLVKELINSFFYRFPENLISLRNNVNMRE